jgi:hypothetical protein
MKIRHFLIASLAFALGACGGGPGTPVNGKPAETVAAGPLPAAAPLPLAPMVAAPVPLPAGMPATAPAPGLPASSQSPGLPVPAAAGAAGAPMAEAEAMYRVTFATSWSATSFPTQYPSSRHFSGLVGATHDAAVEFWAPGMAASSGIERMAEQGNKSALLDEVGAATAGHVGGMLSGDGIGIAGSDVTLYFTVTQRHSLVTLVSMVAPSPDWFVGVRGLALFEQGAWRERVVVPLPVWDAGTDEGASFSSADIESAPHGVIRLLTSASGSTDFSNGVHRNSGAFLASFTFERIR